MTTSISKCCPVCGAEDPEIVLEVARAAVNSVVLLDSRATAADFAARPILLGACRNCGFAWNTEFDANSVQYGQGYESTQAHSSTFNQFHHKLASDLVQRHDLQHKYVTEIGCGQGEFLRLLHELGVTRLVGYDPAFDGSRPDTHLSDGIHIIAKHFEQVEQPETLPDLVCCKMTLEHIPDVANFVNLVRSQLMKDGSTSLFQVPNLIEIERTAAFWDIYYEHCSYFTPAALQRLFFSCEFNVSRVWTDYAEQYLFIEATAGNIAGRCDVDQAAVDWNRLRIRMVSAIDAWRTRISNHTGDVLLWGGGSKAVAFLAAMGDCSEAVLAAIDINPLKQGTYLPVSALPVVGPAQLRDATSPLVIIMNPVYVDEIRRQSDALNPNTVIETIERYSTAVNDTSANTGTSPSAITQVFTPDQT